MISSNSVLGSDRFEICGKIYGMIKILLSSYFSDDSSVVNLFLVR